MGHTSAKGVKCIANYIAILMLAAVVICSSSYYPASASEDFSGVESYADAEIVILDALEAGADIVPDGGEAVQGGGGVLQGGGVASLNAVIVDHARDIEAIVNAAKMYPHSGFDMDKITQFTTNPIFMPPEYNSSVVGAILPADLEDALNTLKMLRYLAGVPYADISFTDELNMISQHGAYYLAAADLFTHYPENLLNVPQDFFDMAYAGCSRANLSAGYSNLSASIIGQVTDPGANNIAAAGHRRWLLRPGGMYYGAGHVKGTASTSYQGYRSSLYIYDNSGIYENAQDSYIAWPASGDFPIQYHLGINEVSNYIPREFEIPWSINLGEAYQVPSKDDITLTLKRYRGGSLINTWTFDSSTPTLDINSTNLAGMHLAVDNSGYGMRKAIIFKPDSATLGLIRDGDVFCVHIQGLISDIDGYVGQPLELAYDIRFFDLSKEMNRNTVTFDVRHGGSPVEGAAVSLNGDACLTDSNGIAKVRVDNNKPYNYEVKKDGYFTESGVVNVGDAGVSKIIEMKIPVTFTFANTVKTYSGAPQGITAQASPNIPFKVTYNGSDALPVDAGTYTVAAVATAGGYAGQASAVFTINRAPLTVSAEKTSVVYGDALPAPAVTFSGLVGRDAEAGSGYVYANYDLGAPNAPNGRYKTGDYTNKISVVAKNYNITILNNVLSIIKKSVTVSGLAAYDRDYIPGDIDARLNTNDAKIIGACDGDDVYVVTVNATAQFANDKVGDSKIVNVSGLSLGGAQSGNYMLENSTATLTASIKTKPTGQPDPGDITSPITSFAPGGGGGGVGGGGGGSSGGGVDASAAPAQSGAVTPSPSPAPTPTPAPSAPIPAASPAMGPGLAATDSTMLDSHRPARISEIDKNALFLSSYSLMADIGATYWAADQIAHLVALGIVDGYPQLDGTFVFEPEKPINRAEFMKLIAASLKLPLIYDFNGERFSDWDDIEDWAKPYVATLVNSGIVLGSIENGSLCINPLANITREEMTVMAVRSLNIQTGDIGYDINALADLLGLYIGDIHNLHDWALDAVVFAIAEGLASMRDDNGMPLPPTVLVHEDAQGNIFIKEIGDNDNSKDNEDRIDGIENKRIYFMPELASRRDEAAVLLSGLIRLDN